MKKFLLILFTTFIFWISSEIFAQNITRYSEYFEDWTLYKQLFDLWDSNISLDDYKTKIFKIAKFENWTCWIWWDEVEYWENFNWLWRLEIWWNNSTETTFWKFKPWKEFWNLNNEDYVEFCYWEENSVLENRIKIKRTKKQLTLKTIWEWDQKKVVISKEVWDNWTNIEVSLRCEPNDIVFNSIKTWEEEEKFIISLKKLDLKTNNDEFKVKIEWNWLESEIDTVDSFFNVKSNNINTTFYFSPENPEIWDSWSSTWNLVFDNQSRSSKYIWQYPDFLEMSLYEWNISKIEDIFNSEKHKLIAKSNWTSLSANLEIKSQDWNVYSLITKIKWSAATESIKVYSISKYWAKIVSSTAFPTIAKSWNRIHFDVITNIYNSFSELDYAQIVFDDDRFEKLNLNLDDNKTWSWTELSKEITFSWDYTLPSDKNINWQFIWYEVYVILKDWTRTKLDWKKEIYVWTRDDICKDPKMCVLRWLKALKNKEKTTFEKILIENFNENEYNFTENDLYKIFRKK